VNLKIGNAFDVTCERSQVDFEKISANTYEIEYEITLRKQGEQFLVQAGDKKFAVSAHKVQSILLATQAEESLAELSERLALPAASNE